VPPNVLALSCRACWLVGSKRLGECQTLPWIDWKALWPVSCSAFHEKANRVKYTFDFFPITLVTPAWDRGSFHYASIRTLRDLVTRSVHVEVRGRRVLQSGYRPLLVKGLALQRSHPDTVSSIHRVFLYAAWATELW
jgi:hypothetical protein